MKVNIRWYLLLVFLFCFFGVSAGWSAAEVSVNIGVFAPPPPLVIAGPPVVAVIPGASYVYFVPDMSVDVFFYGGYWYRPHEGHWFRARSYRGPWKYIDHSSVSPALLRLPPGYRNVPPGHQKIPYGQLKTNWKRWEKERYWDNRGNKGNKGDVHAGAYGRTAAEQRGGQHNKGNGKWKN